MFGQYGIKVSFWGVGNLIFGICVENHSQRPIFILAEYQPLAEGGGVDQRTIYNIYHNVHIGVINSERFSLHIVTLFHCTVPLPPRCTHNFPPNSIKAAGRSGSPAPPR